MHLKIKAQLNYEHQKLLNEGDLVLFTEVLLNNYRSETWNLSNENCLMLFDLWTVCEFKEVPQIKSFPIPKSNE